MGNTAERPSNLPDDAELRAMIHGHWTLDDERWNSHHREHSIHDIFHQREHDQTEAAIAKQEHTAQLALSRAQEVVDARFEATNEWRGAFSDRERDFLSRTEYGAAHAAVMARIDTLEDKEIARQTRETERMAAQERIRQEDKDRITRLITLVGVASAVGGFLLSVLSKVLGLD